MEQVEAVRIGTVVARDAQALRRWRSASARHAPTSNVLTGDALERAVMSLANRNPEYIAFGESA